MKVFKKVIINLICIALLLVATDFAIYAKKLKNEWKNDASFEIISKFYKLHYQRCPQTSVENKYVLNTEHIYRQVENKDSKLPPILIFSDSFLYSFNINNNTKTYSYILGKITKRPIYNRSVNLLSYSHVLFQLKNEKFYKIVPKPKDIIFSLKENTLTSDVLGLTPWMDLKFYYKKDKNGNFVYHQYSIFENIISLKMLNYKYFNYEKNSKYIDELFLANMKECKNEVEKHWGKDVNFYILIAFPKYNKYKHSLKGLEKLGFKVIYLDDNFFYDKSNFLEIDISHLSEIGNKKLAEYTDYFIENN